MTKHEICTTFKEAWDAIKECEAARASWMRKELDLPDWVGREPGMLLLSCEDAIRIPELPSIPHLTVRKCRYVEPGKLYFVKSLDPLRGRLA